MGIIFKLIHYKQAYIYITLYNHIGSFRNIQIETLSILLSLQNYSKNHNVSHGPLISLFYHKYNICSKNLELLYNVMYNKFGTQNMKIYGLTVEKQVYIKNVCLCEDYKNQVLFIRSSKVYVSNDYAFQNKFFDSKILLLIYPILVSITTTSALY